MLAWIIDVFTNMHWGAVGQIIMIDILLGGDNAVVIALACRNLPKDQRSKGVFGGTAGAIILRVILITFAVLLLNLPFLKVVGGCLLLWIGYKLILPDDDSEEEHIKGNTKLFSAIKTIIVADMVMSIDNVIAIAGAAQQAHEAHQTMLVIFGLLVSVPFIVGGSQIIMKILDKFPVIVLFGGAMLLPFYGGQGTDFVVNGSLLLAFFYLVVIGTSLTFSLYLNGAQKIGGAKAGILSCAEPLSSALLSLLLLGITFTLPDWLGTLLILASVVLIAIDSRRRVRAA